MTDKSGHNNELPDGEEFIEQFPSSQRNSVREIWQESGAVDEPVDVSKEDVEKALSNVHDQITKSADAAASSSTVWKWALAAAIALFVFGAGILLYPQKVEAPHGEMVTTTLPDGSTVELNSGTEIQYNRLYALTNRSVSLNGEAYFSVQQGDHPFTVEANGAVVKVTGTKFNIRSWSNEPSSETEVTVSEGAVQLYPEQEPNNLVTIYPGQLSRWSSQMDVPARPDSVSVDRMLGWRQQQLVFNKEPLLVIFQELERRYDTHIQMEATDRRYETLTTFYAKPQSLESILTDICTIRGLKFAKTANGYRVYQ